MRPLRVVFLGLALLATPLTAGAQATASVVLGPVPTWTSRASSGLMPDQINRADCLSPGAKITFSVTVTATEGNLFQVWSGNNCEVKTNRDENSTCVMVYSGGAVTGSVPILVKDMLQAPGNPSAGVGVGDDTTCDQPEGSMGATARTLYFMVLNQSSLEDPPLGVDTWEFSFDLAAPAAPVLGNVGAGEESLIVDFTAPSGGTELKGYRFYCAADEGGCTSSVLAEGIDPPAANACGTIDSGTASSGTTDDKLPNGVSAAVAVTAIDTLGNVSKLSALGCGIPKDVTGFYEAYRAAGGKAGGGFCGFAPTRRGGVSFAMALLCGALVWLRRRR